MYLVECNKDRVLVRKLAPPGRRIIHAGNKTEIIKKLLTRYNNAVGLIDEDPWSVQPPQLSNFELIKDLSGLGLRMLEVSGRNNRLIMLCPRLEEWIIKASKASNLDLEEYRLPNSPNDFHKQLFNPRHYENLIDDLRRAGSRMLDELAKLLR